MLSSSETLLETSAGHLVMGSGAKDLSSLINLRAEPAPEFAQPKVVLSVLGQEGLGHIGTFLRLHVIAK